MLLQAGVTSGNTKTVNCCVYSPFVNWVVFGVFNPSFFRNMSGQFSIKESPLGVKRFHANGMPTEAGGARVKSMSFLNTKRLQDEQTRRIGRISLILISLLCLIHQVVNADTLETFEGPRNSWSSVLDADCRFLIRTHSRTSQARRSGQQSEFFNYEVERGGSRVLVTHEIDPTLIIRELSPSLWIKSSQPGLQLMVRVVFPNTRSSSPNGGPISALITGPSYTDTNQWQKLSFDSLEFDMKQLLAEKTRQLRTQLPGAIDDRRAYIDRIVLNLYTQPRLSRLWVDALKISESARDLDFV